MPGVDRNSAFMRWYYANQITLKATSQQSMTHLLLSGGILKMTPEQEREALEKLADDIAENRPNYVVEKRTTVFRFCQDYDFVSLYHNGISKDNLIMYLELVQSVLRDMFPELDDEDFMVVVLYARNKRQRKSIQIVKKSSRKGSIFHTEPSSENRKMTKSGFHTVWPHLYVTQEMAIRIRFALCQALRERFPNFATQVTYINNTSPASDICETEEIQYDTWSSVVDCSIYQANGLRMPGSSKASKCKSCPPSRMPCEMCRFNNKNCGYVDDGRPYIIMTVLDVNGVEMQEKANELFNNPHKALQYTSIRYHGTEPSSPFKIPNWFVPTHDLNEELEQIVPASGRKRKRGVGDDAAIHSDRIVHRDFGQIGERKQVNISNRYYEFECISQSDPRAIIFERFLNAKFPHGHNRILLRKVMISTDATKPYIFAVSSSKWCLNVGREHNGQDVYYLYNGRDVQQRCWSSKDGDDHKYGPCRSRAAIDFFKSCAIPMSASKRDEIFCRSPNDPVEERPGSTLIGEMTPQQREMMAQVTAPDNIHPQAVGMRKWIKRLNEFRVDIEKQLFLSQNQHLKRSFGRPETENSDSEDMDVDMEYYDNATLDDENSDDNIITGPPQHIHIE